jgi:hypothetical protein
LLNVEGIAQPAAAALVLQFLLHDFARDQLQSDRARFLD